MPMPLCCMALPFHSSFTTGSGRQQVEGQAHQDTSRIYSCSRRTWCAFLRTLSAGTKGPAWDLSKPDACAEMLVQQIPHVLTAHAAR